MKKIIAIGAIVIVAIVTGVVAFRLSTDALSIIVGAALGMIAILPTLVLAGFLLKKNQESLVGQSRNAQQPPVVVVSGGMMPHQFFQPPQTNSQPAILPPASQSAPRRFHFMGYEDAEGLEISDEEWADAR
jgi:hypothetical protein